MAITYGHDDGFLSPTFWYVSAFAKCTCVVHAVQACAYYRDIIATISYATHVRTSRVQLIDMSVVEFIMRRPKIRHRVCTNEEETERPRRFSHMTLAT